MLELHSELIKFCNEKQNATNEWTEHYTLNADAYKISSPFNNQNRIKFLHIPNCFDEWFYIQQLANQIIKLCMKKIPSHIIDPK